MRLLTLSAVLISLGTPSDTLTAAMLRSSELASNTRVIEVSAAGAAITVRSLLTIGFMAKRFYDRYFENSFDMKKVQYVPEKCPESADRAT